MQLEKMRVVILADGRLDTRNAARYLGLSPKTLAMMRCQGDGPQFIKRGRVFYYKCDLDEWIGQAARVTSTAQAKIIVSTDGHALNSRGRIEI
jgi:hypothetical protein